jgi:hypothetical protein
VKGSHVAASSWILQSGLRSILFNSLLSYDSIVVIELRFCTSARQVLHHFDFIQ